MSEGNKENISNGDLELSMISLFSKKLRIGVIGLGRGGYIKAKHFLQEGSYVEVISKEYNEFYSKLNNFNFKFILGEYSKEFIKDKHIIIIAIDDKEIIENIKKDCSDEYKIYIDSTNFKEGMGAIPSQRKGKNFVFGINTKEGNPKGTVFLANKVTEYLLEYDDFIGYTTFLRNNVKNNIETKKEIIDFINTEDFLFFYKKNKSNIILDMFYNKESFNRLLEE